jgi:hypothetical protein
VEWTIECGGDHQQDHALNGLGQLPRYPVTTKRRDALIDMLVVPGMAGDQYRTVGVQNLRCKRVLQSCVHGTVDVSTEAGTGDTVRGNERGARIYRLFAVSNTECQGGELGDTGSDEVGVADCCRCLDRRDQVEASGQFSMRGVGVRNGVLDDVPVTSGVAVSNIGAGVQPVQDGVGVDDR